MTPIATWARMTTVGPTAFAFMCESRCTRYYIPPIASGRITRGRLASYWLDGFVLVPMYFCDCPIALNDPRGGE